MQQTHLVQKSIEKVNSNFSDHLARCKGISITAVIARD